VFIGTTNCNKNAYLPMKPVVTNTGGRVGWHNSPLPGSFLGSDLIAEAVHFYRQSAQWWPDKDFEHEHIMPQQAKRYEADVWKETIAAYVESKTNITVGQIARRSPANRNPTYRHRDQRRIAAALEQLDWNRQNKLRWEALWTKG
jgi:predicted P-loop ATPase